MAQYSKKKFEFPLKGCRSLDLVYVHLILFALEERIFVVGTRSRVCALVKKILSFNSKQVQKKNKGSLPFNELWIGVY